MPGQGRLGDKANAPLDSHGCPACPHPALGPAIQGSPDVNVNKRPALRVDDPGIHAACCGTNTWTATKGSLTVFINGKGAHRMGDQNRHCGGMGQLVEGSPNVITGESGWSTGAAENGGNASQSQLVSANSGREQGWIRVIVLNEFGHPLVGAIVRVFLAGSIISTAIADASGHVHISNLHRVSSYEIEVDNELIENHEINQFEELEEFEVEVVQVDDQEFPIEYGC